MDINDEMAFLIKLRRGSAAILIHSEKAALNHLPKIKYKKIMYAATRSVGKKIRAEKWAKKHNAVIVTIKSLQNLLEK